MKSKLLVATLFLLIFFLCCKKKQGQPVLPLLAGKDILYTYSLTVNNALVQTGSRLTTDSIVDFDVITNK